MKDKKSFIFHREWYEALKPLDGNIRLEVFDAIMRYVFEEGEIELSSFAKMAMCFILPQLKRDIEKNNSICESRKAFGRKGGLAKASKTKQNLAKLSKETEETEKESLMVLSPTPPISFTIEKEKDKEKEKKVKRKFDVREDLSYVNAEYLNIWMEWLDFKDKINKQYKTDAGVKKQYQHLVNLSNGDVNKAKAIVDQSIMREYEGLFDVKDYKPNVVSIDEQAEKDGFPYKGEDGRHYETRYDMARRQDSYEEWIKQRKK